jgi:hypothetical protein
MKKLIVALIARRCRHVRRPSPELHPDPTARLCRRRRRHGGRTSSRTTTRPAARSTAATNSTRPGLLKPATPISATTDAANGTTKGNGYYVAAKATMPINDQFSVYGKLGLQHSERKLEQRRPEPEGHRHRRLRCGRRAVQPEPAGRTDRRVRALRQEKDIGAKADVLDRGRALQLLSVASLTPRKRARDASPFLLPETGVRPLFRSISHRATDRPRQSVGRTSGHLPMTSDGLNLP